MTDPRPPRADGVDWADIDKPGEFGMTARERDEWYAAMTQTPPAADGGLPGPQDEAERLISMIIAQSVAYVQFNGMVPPEVSSEYRINALKAKHDLLALIEDLEAQLAATSRLASAFSDGYTAGFLASGEGWNAEYPFNLPRLSGDGDDEAILCKDEYWVKRRNETASAWLTSKAGEMQP